MTELFAKIEEFAVSSSLSRNTTVSELGILAGSLADVEMADVVEIITVSALAS